jgi:uncharacterized protein (TIGR02996 family)
MGRKKPVPAPAPEPATQLAGLVQDCKDQPDEYGLRLILADWLDDHGEPERAELIRLSLQVSRPGEHPASQAVAHARLARLRRANDARWLGSYPTYERRTTFRRGFIEIESRIREYRTEHQLAELAALAPWTERMTLHFGQQQLAGEFAESPAAGAFTSLSLWQTGLNRTTTQRVATSPCAPHLRELELHLREKPLNSALPLFAADSGLRGLRSLTMHGPLSQSEVQALPLAPFAPGLRSLTLRYWGLKPWSVAPLVESERLAGLTALSISYNYCGPENVSLLAASPHLRGLRVLRLRNSADEDAGILPLATSPVLASVRILDLSTNNLSDTSVQALARSPHVAAVEELNLASNAIGDAGLRALAESPHLPNLRRLILANNNIGEAGVTALARSSHRAALEVLDLDENPIGARGTAALLASKTLVALRDLSLAETGVDARGIEMLLSGPLAPSLRRLNLEGNVLGPAVAKRLARSPALRHLEALEVSSCPLEAAGLVALANSAHLESLVWLSVPLDSHTEPGVREFAGQHGLPALAYLQIVGSYPLTRPSVDALTASPRRAGFCLFQIPDKAAFWSELWPLEIGFPPPASD